MEYAHREHGFREHVNTKLRANRKSGTPQVTRCTLPWNKETFSGGTKAGSHLGLASKEESRENAREETKCCLFS